MSPAATRLRDAALSGIPCAPVRDLIDLSSAYAVQRELTETRLASGARVVGHKIGLTSPAVQRQLGVDQPDFGVLFDDMDVSDLPSVPIGRLLQPRIEAEIAFILGADGEVAFLAPALEIVDSRIAGWDISIADTIADNASSGLYVLGAPVAFPASTAPRDIQMEMTVNGSLASKGSGEACLGDPLTALAWLAGTAADLGDPLRPGQVVLSGALGPMIPVVAGMRVSATLSGLGTVATRFGF